MLYNVHVVGYSHIFFQRRLGPCIYCLHLKYLKYQAYPKIYLKFLQPQKYPHLVHWPQEKTHK